MGVDGEQVAHPKKRVLGKVLRSSSSEEVKRRYADGIFDHLDLKEAVVELEQMAKEVARRLDSGEEDASAVVAVNKRKE